MIVQLVSRISLDMGDSIVSATYFEGAIIVVTKCGAVYKLSRGQWDVS